MIGGLGAALVALGLAGCGDGTPGGALAPDASAALTAAEQEDLALELGNQSGSLLDAETLLQETSALFGSAGSDPATARAASTGRAIARLSFRRERDCRVSGEVSIEGEATRTVDFDTRTMTLEFEAEKVHRECVLELGERTVSLQGEPSIQVTAFRKRVERRFSGTQTLTLEGSVAWSLVGEEGAGVCRVDLEIVVDPEAGTRTVTGTLCGRQIDRTTEWPRNGSGEAGGGAGS